MTHEKMYVNDDVENDQLKQHADNFISIREIRPLIGALEDACEDSARQAIIISHHPEIINEMGHGDELWFSRPDDTHTVTTPPPAMPGLNPAEVMARGWNE